MSLKSLLKAKFFKLFWPCSFEKFESVGNANVNVNGSKRPRPNGN